jgi:integrase
MRYKEFIIPYDLNHLPLTLGETERLNGACRTPREKRVVWTLLDTGLLVQELAGLMREQISIQTCRLYAGTLGPDGGNGRFREIPITPRIAPLLDRWFSKHESFGLSARSIQRVVRDVACRAGIEWPVCPEALRHTFAVAAARDGMPPVQIQLLLGHARLASTEAYIRLSLGGPADTRRGAGRSRSPLQ